MNWSTGMGPKFKLSFNQKPIMINLWVFACSFEGLH